MWRTIKKYTFDGGRATGCIIRGGDIQAGSGILRKVSASGKWVEGFGVGKRLWS